jgi:hypothetical protein
MNMKTCLKYLAATYRALLGGSPSVGDVWAVDQQVAKRPNAAPVRIVGVRKGYVAYESTKNKTIFREGMCSMLSFRFFYKKA